MNKECIKELGSFIYANHEGFLFSDLTEDQIQQKWIKPTHEIVSIMKKLMQKNLISIYLRGSVANGTAIEEVSDIDFFVISDTCISNELKKQININCNKHIIKYEFITRCDIGFYTKKEILVIKEKVLLKLRARKIYGEDIAIEIPDLRVGKDIAVTVLGLENELLQLHIDLANGVYVEAISASTCKWMAKRIVRAGLEIVSEREFVYTRDLYKCWEVFSKYYPEHKEMMYSVLILSIYPSSKLNVLSNLADIGFIIVNLAKRDTKIL